MNTPSENLCESVKSVDQNSPAQPQPVTIGKIALALETFQREQQANLARLELAFDQMVLERDAARAENARLLDLAELAKLQIANENLRAENAALAARNKTLDLTLRAKDAHIAEQANTMARLMIGGNDTAAPSALVPPSRPSVENAIPFPSGNLCASVISVDENGPSPDAQTLNAEMAQPDAPEGEPVITEAAFAGAVEFVRAH